MAFVRVQGKLSTDRKLTSGPIDDLGCPTPAYSAPPSHWPATAGFPAADWNYAIPLAAGHCKATSLYVVSDQDRRSQPRPAELCEQPNLSSTANIDIIETHDSTLLF